MNHGKHGTEQGSTAAPSRKMLVFGTKFGFHVHENYGRNYMKENKLNS